MSTSTIILLVLGVAILVLLILGFTIGWQKIFPFLSPASNVQDVVTKCETACNLNSKFDFCSTKREVRVEEAISVGGVELGTEFEGSCYDLTKVPVLGIGACPTIDCSDVGYNEPFVNISG